jgi:hypothetical protein
MSMAAKTGWQHVAVTRSGDTFMMFSDGLLMATTSASGTVASTSRNFNIGLDPASDSQCLNGYINDLRILAGHAKYTADFAVPTSTVGTSVSETVNDLTVLYLPFDDDSMEDQARNHAITKNGSTSSRINTSVKKFGTSSARFEDADREIHIPGGKFNLGSSFTIEGWYYLTEYTTHSVGFSYDEIGGSSGKDSLVLGLATSDNKVRFQIGLDGGSEYIMVGHDVTNTKLSLNTWTHVACVRDGTNLYIFKDGVQQGATMTVSSSSLVISQTSTDHVFVIGGSTHSPSPYSNHGMAGYIDDFRIVDGVALYTSNFTPPTSAVGLAVESGGVTTNTVDNKFLSSVWSLKDQNKKISKGEWIRNDVADTGANGRGRSIKGAGLEVFGHRHFTGPGIEASGGTESETPTHKYHVFGSPGTFTMTGQQGQIEYLVIGGGGGGGAGGQWMSLGGGGGAGGLRTGYLDPLTPGTYPVTVGNAGNGGNPGMTTGGSGTSSTFATITSAGGGGGGLGRKPNSQSEPGAAGGSGGGHGSTTGSGGNFPARAAGNTPPTTPSQGNPGGFGASDIPGSYPDPNVQGFAVAGGGGGAGSAGFDGGQNGFGHGGEGTTLPQFPGSLLSGVVPGDSVTAVGPTGIWASGGGGGSNQPGPRGQYLGGVGGPQSTHPAPQDHGQGGGGYGANPQYNGQPGARGTGGGGGAGMHNPGPPGGQQYNRSGQSGGNGIVIIRYEI